MSGCHDRLPYSAVRDGGPSASLRHSDHLEPSLCCCGVCRDCRETVGWACEVGSKDSYGIRVGTSVGLRGQRLVDKLKKSVGQEDWCKNRAVESRAFRVGLCLVLMVHRFRGIKDRYEKNARRCVVIIHSSFSVTMQLQFPSCMNECKLTVAR